MASLQSKGETRARLEISRPAARGGAAPRYAVISATLLVAASCPPSREPYHFRYDWSADYRGKSVAFSTTVACAPIGSTSSAFQPPRQANQRRPSLAGRRLPDGSAVVVRMPDLCEDSELTTARGWKRAGTFKIRTAVFWFDRWPKTDRITGYRTPEALEGPRSPFRNVRGVVVLDVPAKPVSKESQTLAETLGDPTVSGDLTYPILNASERAAGRRQALAEHGNPVQHVPNAQCFLALGASELPASVLQAVSSLEPLTRSEDGSLALYWATDLDQAYHEELITPRSRKDATVIGLSLDPVGLRYMDDHLVASREHNLRTRALRWDAGWYRLADQGAEGELEFALTSCLAGPQAQFPILGFVVRDQRLRLPAKWSGATGEDFVLVDLKSRHAFITLRHQIYL